MISFILKKIVGSQNTRELKKFSDTVEKINALEPEIVNLSNTELTTKSEEFRERIEKEVGLNGDFSDEKYFKELEKITWDILPEAFALVREAGRRTLGMRHFDVQLIGGMVLHTGRIAEMKTGEGKTLVAACSIRIPSVLGLVVRLPSIFSLI